MGRKKEEAIKSSGKRKKELEEVVDVINSFYSEYSNKLGKLNPNDFDERAKATKFFTRETKTLRNEIKTYIQLGYSEEAALRRVLPKAYAVVKVASNFLWNKPHYDVQLIGGILLNEGYASEMATGEGKTLTAALPTYLNALLGKGAHVITPNGYLAKRDQEEMSELYELMGMTCGLVQERGKISEEEIQAKVEEILEVKIDKYTEGAKTEDEHRELVKKFFADKKNAIDIHQARTLAREALQKEDILRRQQAYAADITYGSASAVAFDYLFDDIEKNSANMVQRKGLPNFAVVDEVDAVLFDDATTPFSLSGNQTDEEIAITREEQKAAEKRIRLANWAVYKIITESENLAKRNSKAGLKDRLVLTIKDEHSFEDLLKGAAVETEEYDMTRALLINANTKEYKLTTVGETIIFQYFCLKDLTRILKENKDFILGLKEDGEQVYREGYDYEIKNDRIVMEPRALAHLIISGQIPELTACYNRFGLEDRIKYQPEIDNALRAWFILEEDVDYKLSVPSDAKSPKERIISLVMNGRTAEGRVYSNGLQQAIEAKEEVKKGSKFTIRGTKIKNTLASIPTASFFGRYQKFAGMTGTAAISAFEELYGLPTHEVPRNKPRQVIDRGERMYSSSASKNEAIFQEVLASHKKGQPVLLSTVSIEESQKLFAYLDRRFKEEGIDVKIPVLNANVDKLEEEAEIVSKAGLPGAITISTEMAGRGTDIKLGGEVPDVGDLMRMIGESRVAATITALEKMGKVNHENREKMEEQVRRKVFSLENEDELEQAASKRRSAIKAKKDQMEKEVLAAGGLKVIGSGHFAYSRVDDQVKGRCGRQGNKGEVIFFNDREDLLRIGVPKTKADAFQQQATRGPIIEEPGHVTPLSDAIYDAQSRTEEITKASIKQSQEIENEVAKYRRILRTQKETIKDNNDYVDVVDFMIEETVKSVLMRSSKKEEPLFTDKTRISNARIDIDELISLSSEFLGVELRPEEIRSFKTLGEIREHITEKSKKSLTASVEEKGKEKVNLECKEVVDKFLSRIWYDYEHYVENIKHQTMLNKMAQINMDGLIAYQLDQAFAHCVESERAMIVREIINPKYREKLKGVEPRTELVPVRVTPDGVKRVERDYDKKEQEIIEQMKEEGLEEKTSASNISNLQPRPRIFTLVNKAKLNQDSVTLGGVSKPSIDEELVSLDFGDTARGKR